MRSVSGDYSSHRRFPQFGASLPPEQRIVHCGVVIVAPAHFLARRAACEESVTRVLVQVTIGEPVRTVYRSA